MEEKAYKDNEKKTNRRFPVFDLEGRQFGRLTALSYAGIINGNHCWRCRCSCGKEVIVKQSGLVNGHRKSCGCISHPPVKDYVGKRFGMLTVVSYGGKKGKSHLWICVCDCGKTTTVTQDHLQRGLTKSCGCLHDSIGKKSLKLVAGTSVTKLEARRGKLNSKNTSGYNGVYPQKKNGRKTGRWIAQIGFRGKKYFLGSFEELQDAADARAKAERQMYDGFLKWYYSISNGRYDPDEINKIETAEIFSEEINDKEKTKLLSDGK